MAISLYDATVPSFLQIVASLRGVLDKGLEYANTAGIRPEDLVDARLRDDMFPLHLQVQRVVDHSQGALRDVKKGAFSMPGHDPFDYASLQQLLADTEAALQGWRRDEINGFEGREVLLDTGSSRFTFSAEAFLFSFSIPNFYFHASTAYDILRTKGVPIGKMDFIGRMRVTIGQLH